MSLFRYTSYTYHIFRIIPPFPPPPTPHPHPPHPPAPPPLPLIYYPSSNPITHTHLEPCLASWNKLSSSYLEPVSKLDPTCNTYLILN